MSKEQQQKRLFYTGKELEEMGLISEGTLRNQRVRAKKGETKGILPYVMVGRSVKYRKDDVKRFIKENSVRP